MLQWERAEQTITARETFIMDLGKEDVETEIVSAVATIGTKTWFPGLQRLLKSNDLAHKIEFRFPSIVNVGPVH